MGQGPALDNDILSLIIVPMPTFHFQTQSERDELYGKFVKAIHEVQQKSNFKNLLLEKKLAALADTLEKKVRTPQLALETSSPRTLR